MPMVVGYSTTSVFNVPIQVQIQPQAASLPPLRHEASQGAESRDDSPNKLPLTIP